MRPRLPTRPIAVCAVLALAACSLITPAKDDAPVAEGTLFGAVLSGRYEVPPANSRGAQGTAEVRYVPENHLLTWNVAFSGLTSPATAAHVHGPATASGNAGIVLTLTPRNAFQVDSPLRGSATLTDAQAADLVAGKWYVDIHTGNNPSGEIRGQLMPK
jgi:hypothetical protein